MLKFLMQHASNLAMRALTIVLRFGLVFGLGKYYTTEELGVYGLFNTTITIGIFFLGFDFYAFAHREILKSQRPSQMALIRNSIAFFGVTYLVIFPASLLIFFLNVLPLNLLVWFYVIILLEHFSQELFRLFILFGNQIFANTLLFIRTAAWVIPVALYWAWNDFEGLSLEIVFLLWTIGAGVSVVMGIVKIKAIYEPYRNETLRVDWRWIKKGLPVAAQFLLGTLAYKVIEFSDRYFLDYFLDKKSVGIYTFYYSFANVLQTMVFTVVIAQLYPKLAEYYAVKDLVNFEHYKKKFRNQVTLVSIAGAILMIGMIVPAIHLVGKPEFFDNFTAYLLLIIVVTVLNISYIPHYILYAMERDKIIMVSTIISALLNVLCNIVLTSRFGLIGSAVSTLISYTALMMIKFWYSKVEMK